MVIQGEGKNGITRGHGECTGMPPDQEVNKAEDLTHLAVNIDSCKVRSMSIFVNNQPEPSAMKQFTLHFYARNLIIKSFYPAIFGRLENYACHNYYLALPFSIKFRKFTLLSKKQFHFDE